MKNRTIIGIVCMILAVVMTFAIAPVVNRLTSDTTTVVRLKQEVGRGTKITEDQVETIKVKTDIQKVALYPIHFVQTTAPVCFSQEICNYTPEGRKKIHDNLQNFDYNILMFLMENPVRGQSIEYNDNRISLYVGQRGRCYVTGEKLQVSDVEAHHKKPKGVGGKDEYKNLVFVKYDIHKLIHATDKNTIDKYLEKLAESTVDFERLNNLRILVGNSEISVNK